MLLCVDSQQEEHRLQTETKTTSLNENNKIKFLLPSFPSCQRNEPTAERDDC